jgi:hypothetical protein
MYPLHLLRLVIMASESFLSGGVRGQPLLYAGTRASKVRRRADAARGDRRARTAKRA